MTFKGPQSLFVTPLGPTSHWRSVAPYALSLLRVMAGFLLMQYGSAKRFAFPAAIMPGGGTPPLGSMASIAGILEVVGGALLVLGLFTRAIAFLLSGEMAVAYFVAHAPNGFWPVLNDGALAALNCFVFLYLSAAGAGPWSIDGVRASSAPSTGRRVALDNEQHDGG